LQHSREVAWTAAATVDIEQHAAVLKLYSGAVSDAVAAITQALQVDVRSSYMTDKVSCCLAIHNCFYTLRSCY
jgi:hypothetical protein